MLARKPGWDRDVILIDMRNHGKSEHTLSMSLNELSGDIVNFIESRGIRSASLMVRDCQFGLSAEGSNTLPGTQSRWKSRDGSSVADA